MEGTEVGTRVGAVTGHSTRSVLWIPILLVVSTFGLYLLSLNFPELQNDDGTSSNLSVKFPTSMDDLHQTANFLARYRADHIGFISVLFVSAYIYKQTFAIPGSVFLNLLAGWLFGAWIGFPLVCFLTAIGASNCYLLSNSFGKLLIFKYFPQKVSFFQQKVKENMDSLFFFLLFLRLFPMSPNWFMNMVAPIVNVPIRIFFISVFIGLMPYNFICVQTGCMLSSVRSLDEMFTTSTIAQLAGIALVALVPGILVKTWHRRKQKSH